MEKTHVIINGVINNTEHKIVFEGSHDECRKWIHDKSFDYQILEKEQINKMFKVSSTSCRAFLIDNNMTIEEKIRKRLHVAMKNSNAFEKSILRTILAEFSRIGKNVDDKTAINVLLTMRKALEEIGTQEAEKESLLISEYLPVVMNEDEIETIILAYLVMNEGIKFKDLKDLFDKNYPGQNGALVAKCIKKHI